MKTITVNQALTRVNIEPGSEAMKTIGRRVAQSWRATFPDQALSLIKEGKYNVILYPYSFRENILKIARKYCKQRNRPFVVAKRKRSKKPLEVTK